MPSTLLASAVPSKVTLLAVLALSARLVMVGVAMVVSTFTVCAALTALTLPAASVWVALKVQILLATKATWLLAVLAVLITQAPLALAVVVKVWVLASLALAVRVTLALASAPLPLMVGAALLLAVGAVMLGAAAVVSMVKTKGLEVLLALTSLAVMGCEPLLKLLAGVKVHTPVLASEVVLPSKVVPSYTCTVPFLVTATPVKAGAVLLVMASRKVPLSLALAKAGKPMRVVSTVKV